MVLPLVFLCIPLAIYLILVALPRGRLAVIGIGLASVIAILMTAIGMSTAGAEALAAIGLFSASAVTLAALVQVLRRALGADRPVWVYPALVLFGLLAGGWPITKMMGS
jgi:hypothetical protein